MNPSWVKTQADRQKVYREYMASLKLEESNIDKTANALKNKELTGQVSKPLDTRSTSEKYMDIYRLRNELESGLSAIMSPDEASKVVSQLDEDEIRFGRTQLSAIVKDLKPRFELGVPAAVFINYLRRLLEKFIITEGVENAVGQNAGIPANNLLSSFADINAIRANLESLQEAIARAYSQFNTASAMNSLNASRGPIALPGASSAPDTSMSMALVPYTQVRNEIQSALFLLPSQQELDELRNANIEAKAFIYQVFTDIERFFPDSRSIDNIIKSLLRAGGRQDINEINDIIHGIMSQIALSGEQQDGLKQIKDLANSQGEEERQIESQAGGRRVEITGRKETISQPKKATEKQSLEDAPIKTFRIADKALAEGDNKKLDSVVYKPMQREEFIHLGQGKKEGYIAKALLAGDIPQGSYGLINEKDENGNNYRTILTPKLVLTNIREGQKKRPRHTASQLIDIFDTYLEGKANTEEEPIEEVSGTPTREASSSNMSLVSQNTPAGVASLLSPKGEKEKKGKGIRGRGLAPQRRNRVEGRIEREPEPRSAYSFAPFGRYIINTNKLSKCILTINTKTGKSLPRLKSQIITKALTQIFKEIAKGKEITNEMTGRLTDDEIDTLYDTLNECHLLSKYNTPTSQDLSKTEKELHRFMILKGQISAGQNNEAVVREFKALLLKYMKKGQIPKSEGYDILEELLVLGY
jgi:hypothetical protein